MRVYGANELLFFNWDSLHELLFFNWDSLHAWLNSHWKAWSYKTKKNHKKIKAYRKSLKKEPTVNRCPLILDIKPFRLWAKGKHFIRQRILEFSCVRKGDVDIDILKTCRNGDRKIMQSIQIKSRTPSKKRKWNQLRKF